jgi:hypothetical protein
MSSEELKLLQSSIGNTICFNQFFSTTRNRNVAQIFAASPSDRYCSEHVLFTIEIDSSDINMVTTPFADISSLSHYSEEQEILFSMYPTFRVLSVQLVGTNSYQINLKYVNNPRNIDCDEKSIFNPYTDEIFNGNSPRENKQHIGFQLLLDMIFRLDSTEYSKQELFEYCRSKYQHDPRKLQRINEFEVHYQSRNAIEWYTTENFLSHLLNQSEFIDCIVKMRDFINDLHKQLIQLRPPFIESLNGERYLTLYRARTMGTNQLNGLRSNIGGLISIKSFLWATQNKRLALALFDENHALIRDEVSVLYEMFIDTSIKSVPYAKIQNVPQSGEEILLSMGSIFRIRDVYECQTRMYYIKLIMEHIEDELWNRLTGHLD